jgi:hypothetical protein
MTTLTYTVTETKTITEEVEGTRVTACCWSDDHVIEYDFDCTEAIADINKKTLEVIIQEDWGLCEETDRIANWYADTRTNRLFTYLQTIEGQKEYGFEVRVDQASALRWLEENRAEWLEEWLRDEDMAKELRKFIKLHQSS